MDHCAFSIIPTPTSLVGLTQFHPTTLPLRQAPFSVPHLCLPWAVSTWAYVALQDQNGCRAYDSVQVNVVAGPTVGNQIASTTSGIALNMNLDALILVLEIPIVTRSFLLTPSMCAQPFRGVLRRRHRNTDRYVNSTGSDVTITYTITPIDAGGCEGTPFSLVVTVLILVEGGFGPGNKSRKCDYLYPGRTFDAFVNANREKYTRIWEI
ncbi:MAG: PKD-like domain-containing protein [Bacteroidia bacterium]